MSSRLLLLPLSAMLFACSAADDETASPGASIRPDARDDDERNAPAPAPYDDTRSSTCKVTATLSNVRLVLWALEAGRCDAMGYGYVPKAIVPVELQTCVDVTVGSDIGSFQLRGDYAEVSETFATSGALTVVPHTLCSRNNP